jgi:hypothetical protein
MLPIYIYMGGLRANSIVERVGTFVGHEFNETLPEGF